MISRGRSYDACTMRACSNTPAPAASLVAGPITKHIFSTLLSLMFTAASSPPSSPRPTPQYGVDLNAKTPKNWTPLSYARAKGKYGLCHEKGIYSEDVLKARRRR